MTSHSFSVSLMEKTRLTLRLPPDLAELASVMAGYQGLTVNAFIVQAVRNWADYHARKAVASLPSGDRAVVTSKPGSVLQPAAASRSVSKVPPNQPCPCGSGKKYKRCHGQA